VYASACVVRSHVCMLILSVCVLKISFVLIFLWRTTGNNLGAEGAAALAPALGRMPNLTQLDLSGKCSVCICGWGVGACVVWSHGCMLMLSLLYLSIYLSICLCMYLCICACGCVHVDVVCLGIENVLFNVL